MRNYLERLHLMVSRKPGMHPGPALWHMGWLVMMITLLHNPWISSYLLLQVWTCCGEVVGSRLLTDIPVAFLDHDRVPLSVIPSASLTTGYIYHAMCPGCHGHRTYLNYLRPCAIQCKSSTVLTQLRSASSAKRNLCWVQSVSEFHFQMIVWWDWDSGGIYKHR